MYRRAYSGVHCRVRFRFYAANIMFIGGSHLIDRATVIDGNGPAVLAPGISHEGNAIHSSRIIDPVVFLGFMGRLNLIEGANPPGLYFAINLGLILGIVHQEKFGSLFLLFSVEFFLCINHYLQI